MNIKSVKEKIWEIYKKEDSYDRKKLAKSEYTPIDVLEKIYTDVLEESYEEEAFEIILTLLGNSKIKDSLREKLMETRAKFEKKIIENLNNSDYYVSFDVELLMKDKNTSPEALTTLYKNLETISNETVWGYFVPSDYEDEEFVMGEEEFEEFLGRKKEGARNDLWKRYLDYIYRNPNVPEDIVKDIQENFPEEVAEMQKNEEYEEYLRTKGNKSEQRAEELLSQWNEDSYESIKSRRLF